MKPILSFLFAALLCTSAAAADLSCAKQVGQPLANLLAQQCRQVSPATHPPCNAANSCALIVAELQRGCEFLAGEADRPRFCAGDEDRAGSFRGYLFSGGGTDATYVEVLTKQGKRVWAYCQRLCDDMFTAPDEHEVVSLEPRLVGRRVIVDVAIERNNDRVPGPSKDDRIAFVKRIRLLR